MRQIASGVVASPTRDGTAWCSPDGPTVGSGGCDRPRSTEDRQPEIGPGVPFLPVEQFAPHAGLVKTLANELAPHMIRVNSVHPTSVDTTMIHNE
jgi:hypothetical protein